MPAGVSWGAYMKFFSCAMLSMLAGSQVVHMYYKPLQDLNVYIEKEIEQSQLSGLLNTPAAASTKTIAGLTAKAE